jgi:hypothetical protein
VFNGYFQWEWVNLGVIFSSLIFTVGFFGGFLLNFRSI